MMRNSRARERKFSKMKMKRSITHIEQPLKATRVHTDDNPLQKAEPEPNGKRHSCSPTDILNVLAPAMDKRREAVNFCTLKKDFEKCYQNPKQKGSDIDRWASFARLFPRDEFLQGICFKIHE